MTSSRSDDIARTTRTDEYFLQIIQELELTRLQHEFLRLRWLNQVRWASRKAASAQRWYRILRITTIVGGVVIPALVALDTPGLDWVVFALGLVVALAAAIDGFLHYGDRWPHYRRMAEVLKSEGWQFLQLSGPYAAATTHAVAYPTFATNVEAILRPDVEEYFTTVVPEQRQDGSRS
jgi:hypothetical protein